MHLVRILVLCAAAALSATAARAQEPDPAAQPERSDPDALVDALQPEFNLVALPTTLRMPVRKWAFRVTHRFTRSLGQGDFGDLAGDAFGFDGGAQIGLELRYGLLPGTQIGIHRTSERTIQLFAEHNFLNQRDGGPVGLDFLATFEGTGNLTNHRQGAFGFVVSRNVRRFAAVYAEPILVVNSSAFTTGDNHTMMLGLGARLRIRPSLYLVGEYAPRMVGYDPGADQLSFGIESRAGGHLFQLNFSNGFGTTLGQLSRGGIGQDNWYLGFNIARKFF